MGDAQGSTPASATKGASETEPRGGSSPESGSPKPSLEAAADGSSDPLSAPHLTVLLLLLAASLCLEP